MSASGNFSSAGAAARTGLLACLCALSGCGEAGPDAAGAREALHALLLETAQRDFRTDQARRDHEAETAAKRKARGEKPFRKPPPLPPFEVRIEAFELLSAERAPTEAAEPDEALWNVEAHCKGRVAGLETGIKTLGLLGEMSMLGYGQYEFEGRYRFALRSVPGASANDAPHWEIVAPKGRRALTRSEP